MVKMSIFFYPNQYITAKTQDRNYIFIRSRTPEKWLNRLSQIKHDLFWQTVVQYCLIITIATVLFIRGEKWEWYIARVRDAYLKV